MGNQPSVKLRPEVISGLFGYINALEAHLVAAGVKVVLSSPDLPADAAGRFRYPDSPEDPTPLQIDVADLHPLDVLLTLAHEAGHFRAWQKDRADHDETAAQREGAQILCDIGYPFEQREWQRFHRGRPT